MIRLLNAHYRSAEFAVIDRRIGEAVAALLEIGATFAEDYVETSALGLMAGCLRWLRTRETPAEQAAPGPHSGPLEDIGHSEVKKLSDP